MNSNKTSSTLNSHINNNNNMEINKTYNNTNNTMEDLVTKTILNKNLNLNKFNVANCKSENNLKRLVGNGENRKLMFTGNLSLKDFESRFSQTHIRQKNNNNIGDSNSNYLSTMFSQ